MKKIQILFIAVMLAASTAILNLSAASIQTKGSIEEDDVGTVLEETLDFGTYWEAKAGLPESSYGKIAEDEEGKYIDITGIYSFISYDEITSPSEFAVDLRANAPHENIGVCFRTGYVFNLYEWDFHVEKGGQDGLSSIGATGIVLSPIEGGIRLTIKTQDDNSTWGISSVFHDFLIEGIDYSKFVPLRFKDDGKTTEIYVNNKLLATVHMENEGDYESDYDTEIFEYLDYTYYKTVSVKDAQGSEVLKTEKARLVSESFFAGVAVRNTEAHFKNVELTFTTANATEEPQQTPEETVRGTAETPATKIPEKATATVTKAPLNTPAGDSSGENGASVGTIIGISAGIVVIGAIIIVVVIQKKRK